MSTTVLSVDAKDPAGEVLRLFADHPIHHLPVLDDDKVVGMLSTADLMKLDLFVPKGGASPIEYLNRRIKVGALVRRPLISIEGHCSLETAAQLMAEHGVHALPVVDAKDRLLGIVTTTDIINAALAMPQGSGPPKSYTPIAAQAPLVQLSTAELAEAQAAAEAAAGTAQDAHFVCKAVVYLVAKLAMLDHVREAAERYVNAGQDEHLHLTLIKALESARQAERRGYRISPPRR
jgi:CBS domain-containing protein